MVTTLRSRRSDSPSDGASAPTLVLLHGFGSSEHDLAGLAPALGLDAPWISVRAPLEMPNGGAAWFAITTPGDPDEKTAADATDTLWAFLDEELGTTSRIVPIGFSQGGLMASHLWRTRPERVVAPVILGGFVAGATQPGDATLHASRPPLFWGRGALDRVITAAAVSRTADFLPQHSALEERVYPDLAHGIHADELGDVRAFLIEHAGVRASSTS